MSQKVDGDGYKDGFVGPLYATEVGGKAQCLARSWSASQSGMVGLCGQIAGESIITSENAAAPPTATATAQIYP